MQPRNQGNPSNVAEENASLNDERKELEAALLRQRQAQRAREAARRQALVEEQIRREEAETRLAEAEARLAEVLRKRQQTEAELAALRARAKTPPPGKSQFEIEEERLKPAQEKPPAEPRPRAPPRYYSGVTANGGEAVVRHR